MIHEAQIIADTDADFIHKIKINRRFNILYLDYGLCIIVAVTTIDVRECLWNQRIMLKVRETEIQCMFYLSNGKRDYEWNYLLPVIQFLLSWRRCFCILPENKNTKYELLTNYKLLTTYSVTFLLDCLDWQNRKIKVFMSIWNYSVYIYIYI